MKAISTWRHLEQFGIILLTGEACGLMYRFLCDVTPQGKAILEKLFDCELKLTENWNAGATGSIMLANEMLIPIGIFALLESGCTEVWMNQNTLIGVEPGDNPDVVEISIRNSVRRFSYSGTAGSRNRHEMTKRVV